MPLRNHTPFPALAWENIDASNQNYMSSLCRVKYKLMQTDPTNSVWELSLDPQQGELFGSDIYIKEGDEKELRYPSDYVSYKSNTDIIINAHAYAPERVPCRSWDCAVEVFDPYNKLILKKTLRVNGERFWRRAFIGWRLDKPEECKSIPIRYAHAFGGKATLKHQEDHIYDEYNRAGCGLVHKEHTDKVIQAPRIESADILIRHDKPYEHYLPQGFGAIEKTSYYRFRHAGTYDESWLENHHPLLPHDYNDAYNQSAHPDLIVQGYLLARSKLHFINLSEENGVETFVLPDFTFTSRYVTNTTQVEKTMNIDTIIVDMDDADRTKWSVYLSWRNRYPIDETIQKVEIYCH